MRLLGPGVPWGGCSEVFAHRSTGSPSENTESVQWGAKGFGPTGPWARLGSLEVPRDAGDCREWFEGARGGTNFELRVH